MNVASLCWACALVSASVAGLTPSHAGRVDPAQQTDRGQGANATQTEVPPKPPDPEHAAQDADRPVSTATALTDARTPPPAPAQPAGVESTGSRAQDAPHGLDDAAVATLPRSASLPLGAFRFDYASAADHGAYEAMLDHLSQVFPELVQVRSLGQSRGGRDLWLLRAGDARAAELDRRPAVFVCTTLDARPGAPALPPNGVLYLAESLFWNARTQVEIERLFKRCTLYFAPVLDPDRVFVSGATSGLAARADSPLARNFPTGWEPWGAGAFAHGPYPLSEPESRAVASFLESHRNVCAVVMLDGSPAPAASAITAEGTEGGAPAPGGSLERFCRGLAGARVYVRPAGAAPPVDTPLGPAPADFASALAFVTELCAALPELACTPLAKERLRTDLWMVDLKLVNTGRFSTRGESAPPSTAEPSVWMRCEGAAVVAAAVRRDPAGAFEPLPGVERDQALTFLGDLDGGASLDLRLIVTPPEDVQPDSVPEDAQLDVVFEALRAGRTRIAVPLH